jgi:hypothetical protein
MQALRIATSRETPLLDYFPASAFIYEHFDAVLLRLDLNLL